MAVTVNTKSVKPESEQDAQKVGTYNELLNEYDAVMAGLLEVPITSANVTLTRTQALSRILKLTGILTGNRTLFIPHTGGASRQITIWNATSGAFTVTVKTTAGGSTGPAITQGKAQIIFHDGTNVKVAAPEVTP
jgi:hypothetical protein